MLLFKLLSPMVTPPQPIPDYDVGFVNGVWTNNSSYTESGGLAPSVVGGAHVLNCTGGAYKTLNGHPMSTGNWTACFDVEFNQLGDIRVVSTNTAARLMSMGTYPSAGYNLCVFSTDDGYYQPQNIPLIAGQRMKIVLKCVANQGFYLSTTTSSTQLLISPSMFSGNGLCLGFGYGGYQYLIHDFRLFDNKLLTDQQINQYLA